MLTFRHFREEDRDAFIDCLAIVYSFDRNAEYEKDSSRTFEEDRHIAAFDGDSLVGTLGSFSLDMAVPGGSLPTAGTTIVSVLTSHRRQGALRGLISAHFDEIQERGEPLAALWASEMPIYGRFGYGWAADHVDIKLDTRHAKFRGLADDVTVRISDTDAARKIMPAIYDEVWPQRPGMFARSDDWWDFRRLRDLPERRGGATAQRFAIAERAGKPIGYLIYRTKDDWSSGHGEGEVRMLELVASENSAEVALWNFATSIDLAMTVTQDLRPVDDPLLWNLVDARRLNRKISDSLWVRVMDVEAALTGRSYSADGTLTLKIDDAFLPEQGGTFQLTVTDGAATCGRTDAEPDITMPTDVLGATYMGGKSIRDSASVGRVIGDTASLKLFDQMFSWHPLPWCQEIF